MPAVEPSETRAAFGGFLDDLVHELRTPLTAIAGYAALLADEAELLSPDARHAVGVIDAQSARLGRQLALVLEIARLWSGQMVVERERLNLAALVRRAARSHHVPVEAPARLALDGDNAVLRRAVAVLIDNAIRHGAPPVTVQVWRGGSSALVAVCNHGSGLPPAAVAMAGVRPFQAPPHDGPPVGTGLSLVWAAAVAAAHHGSLAYARADGVSCFTLTLPVPRRSLSMGKTT